MNCLAPAQHRHVLFDSLHPRFCLLRIMNTIKNCVSICPVELIEVSPGGRVAIEPAPKIFGNLRPARRCISGFPSAVEFGFLDFTHPRRPHPTEFDQNERSLAIDPGPFSLGAAGREANEPIIRVELVDQPVYPAVTKRAVDCFPLRDARDVRRSLRKLQPHALRRARLCCEPRLPFRARCKTADRKLGLYLRRRHSLCVLIRARQVVVERHAETVERPRDQVVLPDRENRVHHLLDTVAL